VAFGFFFGQFHFLDDVSDGLGGEEAAWPRGVYSLQVSLTF
jgi:hypothetical protein